MKPVMKQGGQRSAFTIVELLTVMSIIVILIGFTVAGSIYQLEARRKGKSKPQPARQRPPAQRRRPPVRRQGRPRRRY